MDARFSYLYAEGPNRTVRDPSAGIILIGQPRPSPRVPLEVAFRLEHDCRLCLTSRDHPDAVIKEWCNNVVEVIHVHVPDTGTGRGGKSVKGHAGPIVEAIASQSRGVYEQGASGGTGYILRQCHCKRYNALLTTIEEAGCVPLFPLEISGGWELYRALAFKPEHARTLLQRLEERVGKEPGGSSVRLVSKREITGPAAARLILMPAHEVFDGMTERQMGAVHVAQLAGYYQSPRGATTEHVAARAGLARATLEEHLRKGENQLMENLAPYLDLWLRGPAPRDEDAGGDADSDAA